MEELISSAIQRIKEIKVQGATNTALFILSRLERIKKEIKDYQELSHLAWSLATARPDEPLSRNVIRLLLEDLKHSFNAIKLERRLKFYQRLLEENKEKISHNLNKLVVSQKTYLSHCHSTSVEKGLIYAHQQGKIFQVFQTETRPLYQGHITASHLFQVGVDVILIVDDFAPSLVAGHYGSIKINKIFIGADVLSQDGWVVNKVGSFSLGLAAMKYNRPLYVVASLLKYTPRPVEEIVIERRSEKEIWPNHPAGLKILNPAFDKVPPEFITAFVTEVGLVKPKDVKAVVSQVYPEILKKDEKA